LVGESGCGKTSLARAIMQSPPPTAGRVLFQGRDLTALSPGDLRRLRPEFQMILQDSTSGLNPRRRVWWSVAMPLIIDRRMRMSRAEQKRLVGDMMAQVGLDPKDMHLLPGQFSGGQCQRVQIARALIIRPKLLICDEPVSSLDVSVQAQILNLLEDLRQRYRLTMLFISHDLAAVKSVSDRAAVMYAGRLREIAPVESLYQSPRHPYTRALLDALPKLDSAWRPPAPARRSNGPPTASSLAGCAYFYNCPRAAPVCGEREPPLTHIGPQRKAACHFPLA
jgi:peptide/nickel transport system ATP-binding protein